MPAHEQKTAVTIARATVKIITRGNPHRKRGGAWRLAWNARRTKNAARFLDQALRALEPPIIPHYEGGSPGWRFDPTGPVKWAPMDVHPLAGPMVVNVRGAWRVTPSDHGLAPRFPWRMLLDGRGFARRKRQTGLKGGSVLYDASGSMGFERSPERIMELLAIAPAAWVAAYAGGRADPVTGADKGDLWVLADRGKRLSSLDHVQLGGENQVDGLALAILERQAPPRIWYSDGAATDRTNTTGELLAAMVAMQCARAGIIRTKDRGEVLRILGGR
jgi:hypothetical protein